MSGLLFVEEKEGAVLFKVRVQPRASKDELAGTYGDALRLRLAAPPVEGQANEACCAFLARLLGVPRGKVAVVGGRTSRSKLVRVEGITARQVLSLLERA